MAQRLFMENQYTWLYEIIRRAFTCIFVLFVHLLINGNQKNENTLRITKVYIPYNATYTET